MPRYINKQRHTWTCGHVAVTNVLKSLSYNVTYSQGINIVEGFKNKPNSKGCWPTEMTRVFRANKIRYKYDKASIPRIRKLLKDGYKLLYFYRHNNRTDGHVVFIDKMTKLGIRMWNCPPRRKTAIYQIKKLKSYGFLIVINRSNYEGLLNANKK